MRINTLSIFQKGVLPKWEDPVNAQGAEYQLRLMLTLDNESSLDKITAIWEQLVMDVVTKRMPYAEQVVGFRIVDKSFPTKENFRLELWTKFDSDTGDEANKIREFIQNEYNSKNIQPQPIQYKNHKSAY